MSTECEANIRGYLIFSESRQNSAVAPGTAAIKRNIVADLKAIVGGISEEFRTTHEMERIVRILGKHRLAMGEIVITAYLNVSVWWPRVRAECDASASSHKRIEWHWSWRRLMGFVSRVIAC